MEGWINQVSAIRFTKSNQKFILKHEFLKINVLPDSNVLSQLQPEAGQTWNCKNFLKKVWVAILCAPETKFNIEADYTYEKICEIDFHRLDDQTIDKMFAKMIHEEAVEFGRSQEKVFEDWLLTEGVTRWMLKNNLKMDFCPLFRQHRNQSICLVKSLVNQWRPVFRHIQIPYQLWYQIAGESLIDDDIMHTLQLKFGCAPSFFS